MFILYAGTVNLFAQAYASVKKYLRKRFNSVVQCIRNHCRGTEGHERLSGLFIYLTGLNEVRTNP